MLSAALQPLGDDSARPSPLSFEKRYASDAIAFGGAVGDENAVPLPSSRARDMGITKLIGMVDAAIIA